MKTFCSIKFGIGSAAAEPLSKEALDFYQWLAEKYSGVPCRIVDEANKNTFPINNEDIQNRPFIIYELVQSNINSMTITPDIAVVDLTGPYQGVFRGALLLHLGHALKVIIDSSSANIKFIILLSEIPPPEDNFIRELSTAIEEGRILLLDTNGDFLQSSTLPSPLIPRDFITRMSRLERDPLELLSLKMVRRLGHFERKSSKSTAACKRYFYDGSKCINEIVDLLKGRINNISYSKDEPLIIYQSPLSPWLDRVISIIEEELRIECFSASSFIRKKKFPKAKCILIITDLVHTGETLLEVYTKLRKAMPSMNFYAITILSTKITDEKKSIRMLKVGNSRIEVQCLLKVAQEEAAPETCPLCRLKIPYSSYHDEDYDILTTYDMWEMNARAGYKLEEDVPRNREALSLVPNYPKLLQLYGAWVVFKIEKILQSKGLDSPDLVVICPDEIASTVFSHYLHLLLGATVIQVPRAVLDKISQTKDGIDSLKMEWEKSADSWFVQIQSLTTDEVILMDEFHVSGGTYKSLNTLIDYFQRSPSCYFPLVDFNPKLSKQFTVPTLSLYQFQRFYTRYDD